MEDLTKQLTEAFSSMPPLLRYPAMLTIAEAITNELPKAEAEYDKARLDIIERFLEIRRSKYD